MEKMQENKSKYIFKTVVLIIAAVFVLSSFFSLTMAWSSMSQGATNPISGEQSEFPVKLLKLCLDTNQPLPNAYFALFRVEQDGTQVQVGAQFVTDEQGQINIAALPPGNYVFVETAPPSGYTFLLDDYGNPIRRHYFTVTGDEEELIIIKAFNRKIDGDLIVEKVVVGEGAPDEEFEFTIIIGDDEPYTFTLRHAEHRVFENIPIGTPFLVVESPAAGFTISSVNHQGVVTEETTVVTFTNTYEPNEEFGDLLVRKITDVESETYFTFILILDDGEPYEFTVRAGEYRFFENIPAGTRFYVRELEHDDYRAQNLYFTGTIVGSEIIELEFENIYELDEEEYGSLTIFKEVPNGSEEYFRFEITIGEETFVRYIRAGESYTFENIPHGTPWRVVETEHDDYISAIEIASGIIVGDHEARANFANIRRLEPEYGELIIEKIAVDCDYFDPYQEFVFTIIVDGEALSEQIVLRAGQASEPIRLPVGSHFVVIEEYTQGYVIYGVVNGTGTITLEPIIAEFTNRFADTVTINIEGEKTWVNPYDVDLPEYIMIRLMNGELVVMEVMVTPDENGEWHFIFEDLPKYDTEGNEIEYTIIELPISGWAAEYDGFDIVNVYVPGVTEVSVTKVWNDGNYVNRPTSVQVQLYRNGVAYGELVTLNATNNWRFTWANLEARATWTVDEPNVPAGYTKSISGGAESGFVITNTKDRAPSTGTVTISGQKTWEHGLNPEGEWPTSVTFMLFADGDLFISFAVNASTDWWYSFELPRYNADGSLIVWTVDEEEIPDYRKSINGFNITNTHISTDDPNWSNETPPSTGDDPAALWFWTGVAAVSLVVLIATVMMNFYDRQKCKKFMPDEKF